MEQKTNFGVLTRQDFFVIYSRLTGEQEHVCTTSMDGNSATRCPVCLETFTRPKYLPCLHTVCEPCIDIYVKSMQKAFHRSSQKSESENGFNCPVCKAFVLCSEKDPTVWARTLPDNTIINTLVERNKLKKKSETCDGCKSRGDVIKAAAWCSECQEALCHTCSKYHKTNKALKNHCVFNVDDLKDDPILICFTEDEMCVQHQDKRVEMFCKHHDALCCILCVTSSHRNCDHVIPIEDVARGIRENGELEYTSNQLKHINCEIQEIIRDRKKNISDFTQQHHRIENDIAKFRHEINQHLDDLEQKCKKNMNVKYNENLADMNKQVEQLQNRKKAITNCQRVLQTSMKHGTDYKLFSEMNKLKHQIRDHEEHVKKQKACMKRIEFSFILSSPATNFRHYLNTLADIKITTSKYPNIETPYTTYVTSTPRASRHSSPMTSFQSVDLDLSSSIRKIEFHKLSRKFEPNESSNSRSVEVNEFSSSRRVELHESSNSRRIELNESYSERTESRRSSTESNFLQLSLSTSDLIGVKEADLSKTIYVNKLKIIDAAFLPDERIMLVASNGENWRLYVYTSNGSLQKEIRLRSHPGGVTVLSKQESAITFPEEQIIQFIDNKDFSMAKDMKIRGHCRQISSVNNKMVIVCETELKLFNGTSVRTVPIAGSEILCICLSTKDRLYFTMQSDSSLHCISTTGCELFKYCHGDLVCPYGVALGCGDRLVYVTGYKSQNIHQITPEGRLLTIIVTRGDVMSGPQLLAVNQNGEEFLQIWEQMYGNFIYVYNMPRNEVTSN